MSNYILSVATPRFAAMCEFDLALSYCLRRPKLAIDLLRGAYARAIRHPDLSYLIRETGLAMGVVL